VAVLAAVLREKIFTKTELRSVPSIATEDLGSKPMIWYIMGGP
jgi:hypothetical protein